MAYERTRPHTPVMFLPQFAKKFYETKGKTLAADQFREIFTADLIKFMSDHYIAANQIQYFNSDDIVASVREKLVKVFERISSEVKKVVSLVASGKNADYSQLWEAFSTAADNWIGSEYDRKPAPSHSYYSSSYYGRR